MIKHIWYLFNPQVSSCEAMICGGFQSESQTFSSTHFSAMGL